MIAKIEWDTIGQLLWAAPVAALAVSLTFSLVVLGAGRAGEARRRGGSTAVTAYTALTGLAGVAFVAVVVYGVQIIFKK